MMKSQRQQFSGRYFPKMGLVYLPRFTSPKTDILTENQWLEDDFFFGHGPFFGGCVSFWGVP